VALVTVLSSWATGFALNNKALIICGALDGGSASSWAS
jgi:NAD/NADP transhydrogenase beta subunit